MAPGDSRSETAAPEPLFQPSHTPRLPALDIVLIIVSMLLVFGGFYMMALAFSIHEWAIWLFVGGIVVDAIGFWIAFGLLPARDDNRR